MKDLDNVKELFSDKKSAKIITTISAAGELHAIVAGTVVVLDNDRLAFGEVFMKKTTENLLATGKIAILAEKGAESYLVNAVNPERHTNDEVYETFASKFGFLQLPIAAVWTCEIEKIFNQGANPSAGTQLF